MTEQFYKFLKQLGDVEAESYKFKKSYLNLLQMYDIWTEQDKFTDQELKVLAKFMPKLRELFRGFSDGQSKFYKIVHDNGLSLIDVWRLMDENEADKIAEQVQEQEAICEKTCGDKCYGACQT